MGLEPEPELELVAAHLESVEALENAFAFAFEAGEYRSEGIYQVSPVPVIKRIQLESVDDRYQKEGNGKFPHEQMRSRSHGNHLHPICFIMKLVLAFTENAYNSRKQLV